MISSIGIEAGKEVNKIFHFQDEQSTAELRIEKKETAEKTYKFSVKYLGKDSDQEPNWKIYINDKSPVHAMRLCKNFSIFQVSDHPIRLIGSKILKIEPYKSHKFKISETDSTESCQRYIDDSGEEMYLWVDNPNLH